MKQDMIQKSTPRAGALTRLLMTALIALTTLAACHDELADDRLSPDARTVTLSVSMPAHNADGTQTRVAYADADLKLKWQEGDELKVYGQSADDANTLLGTLIIESGSISTDSTNAKFKGKVTPATGKYSLRYAPDPAPDQMQKSNANTDHLRSHLVLSANEVSSLTEPVTLTLDAAILKVRIVATNDLTTQLGTLKSLQWNSETAKGTISTKTLGLENVTPNAKDSSSITAYIAFRPTEMNLASGGTFNVTLTNTEGIQFIAFTTSGSGKTYEPGKRYTVEMSGGTVGPNALRLRPRRVEGNGADGLDPNIFNQYSPEWVINGNSGIVATNVKTALDKLKNPPDTISLTLTEVTELPEKAFSKCAALTSMNLPKATIINADAFNNCTKLTSMNLPEATSIGDSAFSGCAVLTSIELPKATTIDAGAFGYCTKLTSMSLSGATSIGDSAFNYCGALTSIKLPNATTIKINAFNYCTALTSMSLPMATDIAGYAFNNCTALNDVDLPEVTIIRKNMFNNCPLLTDVKLPKAKTIEDGVFTDCKLLTTISLPAATKFGSSVFIGCLFTRLELTAAGIVLDKIVFNGFTQDSASNCDLVLNKDKEKEVSNGNTWFGLIWKSITYAP